MKDRIKKFIDYKGITPAELAAKLDVQRSNISHILNGRNKPGAGLIEKFLLEFPELNARWLLIGSGEMVNSKKEIVKDLFDSENFKPDIIDHPIVKERIQSKNENLQSVKIDMDIGIPTPKSEKSIEKIVVFFDDKTFREYQPE